MAVRVARSVVCAASTAAVATWFEPAAGAGEVSITSAPVGAAYTSYASFSFDSTAAPGTVTFEYSLDGSSWAPTAATLQLGPLAPGPHTLVTRCTDGVSVSANQSAPWTILSQSSFQLQVVVLGWRAATPSPNPPGKAFSCCPRNCACVCACVCVCVRVWACVGVCS